MKKLSLIVLLLASILLSSCSRADDGNIPSTTERTTIVDSNGYYIPIYDNVDMSKYDIEKYTVSDNGRITYNDEEVKSYTGIDISVFQGDIDWNKVACDGIDFVMLRTGCRGYGPSGLIYEDDNFRKNYEGAISAGLDVGLYFFSQAITPEEATEEAEFVLDLIKDKTIKYPVAYDWEPVEDPSARTALMTIDDVTSMAKAFCNTISKKGYDSVLYFNRSDSFDYFNLSELSDYHFWLAQYTDKPDFYYNYQMWQYTRTGSVDGIDGNVDINICLYDYASKNS